MTSYVAGFLFTRDRRNVVLIEKRRPSWQAGKLNGVGGKIERGESPLDAMTREFLEEAGPVIFSWSPVAELRRSDFTVHFFAAFSPLTRTVRSKTDEQVGIYAVDALRDLPVVPNLRVLIPLALDQSGIRKPVIMHDALPDAANTG